MEPVASNRRANSIRSSDNDQVIVKTGSGEQVVQGLLEKIDATHLHVNFRGKSRKIGLAKVVAVIVADLKLAPPKGRLATTHLIDQSKVRGVVHSFTTGTLQLVLAKNTMVKFPIAEVARIEIPSDRVQYLSELQPVEVDRRAIFGPGRSWKVNRSVEGNSLRLRDANGQKVEYTRGIGVASYCALTYENINSFDQFAADVGIDTETDGNGDCELVVMGDGIELWKQRIRAADPLRQIKVDVTGMSRITLIVRPGSKFDLGDHVDWCDARLLKTR